jgi:hypothetical protein
VSDCCGPRLLCVHCLSRLGAFDPKNETKQKLQVRVLAVLIVFFSGDNAVI